MNGHLIPPEVAALEPYVRAGIIGVTEVQVVASLARCVEDPPTDEVLLGLALAVRAPLHGHVRAELSTVAGSVVPDPEQVDPEQGPVLLAEGPPSVGDDGGSCTASSELDWPAVDSWMQALHANPLVRMEGDVDADRRTPIVAVGTAVYLDRLHGDELLVADLLRARAASDPHQVTERAAAALDQLFPLGADGPDAQRRAAEAALSLALVVIAGGPGTGKTRTIARLLGALLHEDDDVPPPQVALAAPTGKAAARLTESIRREASDPAMDPLGADRLARLEAVTLHRLLGVRPSGASRHGPDDPLAADVVVVDEMSMVDLPMAARLLGAVRSDARLVLVGDPSQLASVEAGSVLGDMIGARGRSVPASLAGNVIVLDRAHRFGRGSRIGALATAIDSGDADEVLDLLERAERAASDLPGAAGSRDDDRIRLVSPDDGDGVAAVVDAVVTRARSLAAVARAADAEAALAELTSLQVLAATRRGPFGVTDWNQRIETALSADGPVRGRWSVGRLVLVTANDPLNGVFNGDVGVVVADPGRAHRLGVAFRDAEGIRMLDPSRLDRCEQVWAMTIHKSQGSEFRDVVVTLPPPPSPILTRELLYTAVTRARHGVTIVASEASVRAAVDRTIARASGLAERLS